MQSLQALQHAMGDGLSQTKVRWPPFLEKSVQRRAMVLTHEKEPLRRPRRVESIAQLGKARNSLEPLGDDRFLISDASTG